MAQGSPANKLPAARAGAVGVPLGKIAFIREGNLWIMDWDGKNQMQIVAAGNAEGRVSWAPDGKRIVFSRRGTVDIKGPDNLGGQHRIYDIFIGYVDSAKVNSGNWWRRITEDNGGRYPEWSKDGSKIIITKDLNANTVNALLPNYQTMIIDTMGKTLQTLAYDPKLENRYATMPTAGPAGSFAFVLIKDKNPVGVIVAPPDLKNLTDAEITARAKIMPRATGPSWSPDGNWIAYVDNDIKNQAIYITRPDLSEKFLVYKPSIGQTLQTYAPSWSPNSKWLTFATGDGAIWIIDITGNGLRQIMTQGLNSCPSWSKSE
jgi:Tol biopolymer transport system component